MLQTLIMGKAEVKKPSREKQEEIEAAKKAFEAITEIITENLNTLQNRYQSHIMMGIFISCDLDSVYYNTTLGTKYYKTPAKISLSYLNYLLYKEGLTIEETSRTVYPYAGISMEEPEPVHVPCYCVEVIH